MENQNITPILQDLIQALQPIAKQRGVGISFESKPTTLWVNLPLDEVISPVLSLIVRLLYILPKGRNIAVDVFQRQEKEAYARFLRIEIKTTGFFMNPNLIFKPDHTRFKIEHKENSLAIIFIEWEMEAPLEPIKDIAPIPNASGMEICHESNQTLLNAGVLILGSIKNWENLGNSGFAKDKLKATKHRGDTVFLETALETVVINLENPTFDSDSLGQALHLSRPQLFRKLKALTGYSTANYIRFIRLKKAKELLETTDMSIGDIAYRVGFHDLTYFSSSFMEMFHVTPSDWRKSQKNEIIVKILG